MKHNPTLIATQVALALSTFSYSALAAEESTDAIKPQASEQSKASKAEQVVVTGSRIVRVAKEGPTSVTVLTAKEIEQQGYKSVFDALNNLPQNTGFVQGDDFGNTFTPAANSISLRGLGPNHTLVLLNGHRMADYPIAYQGSVNFVNLADIPAGLIERVEVLNGGASAIYGSDAIAGVVNIILKKHIEGINISARTGRLQHGGGEDTRLSLSGGATFDQLSLVYALDLNRRAMLWSKDRDFMADDTLGGARPRAILSRTDLGRNVYEDLSGICGRFSNNFYGSVSTVHDPKGGSFCGSGKGSSSYWTLQTKKEGLSGFVGLNYSLDANHLLFAEFQAGRNTTENNTRGPSWTAAAASGKSYFLNQNTGNFEQWTKRFAPEEIGGASHWNRRWEDTSANLALGARGNLGETSWTYEAVYSASGYDSRHRAPLFYNGIDEYFLGPQLGKTASGVSIYAPDPNRFYTPVTPEAFSQLFGHARSHNKSWNQTFSLSATGELLELSGGPLKLATVAEWGRQGYITAADPRLAQGVFYNNSRATYVSGARTRYALGAELNAPLTKQITATLAGRYDHYAFAGNDVGKFTYNGGLEYRPSNSLLVRSNYATSFRAPDMNYIFANQTNGYYASTTDYYRCYLAGQPLSNCQFANQSPGANYVQTQNKDLKPENGKSWGLGLVWAPNNQFDLSLDYWKVRIKDEVTNLDADHLLQTEAHCRSGKLEASSAQCLDAFNRIVRNPADAPLRPNAIANIFINPINAADEETSGFDLNTGYRWRTQDWGRFGGQIRYSRVLTHRYRQFAHDEPVDLHHSMNNSDWPDRVTATFDWSREAWRSSLTFNRYGRIPNGDGSAYLSPTWLTNASVGHQINKRASVSLTINNLFDTVKYDGRGGWPFYPVGNYTPYGRQIWLSASYQFGG
ncbi:TonB-dependent receptor [Chitinimonas lacunae]|uniref:TonB-dependent receptor n=1 Tax=Chitinimonas lacunae TaxID=1963018 RepID=A0ABV8MTL5_9NEIS